MSFFNITISVETSYITFDGTSLTYDLSDNAITGYKIMYDISGGISPDIFYEGTSASCSRYFGILPSGDYTFTIYATNDNGLNYSSGISSDNITIPTVINIPVINYILPDAPASLAVTIDPLKYLNMSANITDISAGDYPITGYKITYDISGDAISHIIYEGDVEYCIRSFANLPSGNYTFTIYATNDNGITYGSGTSTSIYIPMLPDAPTNNTITATDESTIDFSWDVPANGGTNITGYILSYTDSSSNNFNIDISANSTTYTVQNLTSLTYGFSIVATTIIGTSTPANFTQLTVPNAPTNLSVSFDSAINTVHLSWDAPFDGGSAINEYAVTYNGLPTPIYTTTNTSIDISGLVHYDYIFTVYAINFVGNGDENNFYSVAVITIPGAPTWSSTTDFDGTNTVNLYWDASTDDGGSAITEYTITNLSIFPITVYPIVGTTSYSNVVLDLMDGNYTFTIYATNSIGNSISVDSNTVTVQRGGGTDINQPSNPVSIVASISINDAGTVHVSWNAPSNDGGTAIIEYSIVCVQTLTSYKTSDMSIDISGFTYGNYEFTVYAYNGTYSSGATSKQVTVPTAPFTPTNVDVNVNNINKITITWEAPTDDGGSAITGYIITYNSVTNNVDATTYSYTTPTLSAGTYTVSVSATNSYYTGSSEPIAPLYVTRIVVSNICFPKDTPVFTDQGYIFINKIEPNIHTINNKKIVAITQTRSYHTYLVCFEKNALGKNCPDNRTLISADHKIFYNNCLISAKKFIGLNNKIKSVNYNGEFLYNVLMEDHYLMSVNNLTVETLHPDNIAGKCYMENYNIQNKINNK